MRVSMFGPLGKLVELKRNRYRTAFMLRSDVGAGGQERRRAKADAHLVDRQHYRASLHAKVAGAFPHLPLLDRVGHLPGIGIQAS